MVLIFVLTVLIHAVETCAYAARLAGARTGRMALANSLFNVLALVARGANIIAGPLVGSLTDVAVSGQAIEALLGNYRVMLLGAALGTLIGGLAIPTLSRILAAAVASYELRGSLPQVIIRGASVRGLWQIKRGWMPPRPGVVRQSWRSPLPKRFLLASLFVTAVYTVSNFAALYASAVVPEGARTATSLAPLLNGFGTLLNIFFIDPIAALITDQAQHGDRPLADVTYITILQIGARLIGTLLAPLLLAPSGAALAHLTHWLITQR